MLEGNIHLAEMREFNFTYLVFNFVYTNENINQGRVNIYSIHFRQSSEFYT